MIWLYSTQAPAIKSFQTFEELCDHFKRFEQILSSYIDTSSVEKWDFVWHEHGRLKNIYASFKGKITAIEQQALDEECDLIDIYTGDPHSSEQYAVTHDLDIASLIKSWCYDYAFCHGFTVLESVSTNTEDCSRETSPIPAPHVGVGTISDIAAPSRYLSQECNQNLIRPGVQP